MSRIRTIKPDFWKHEDLSALPEATHMLAAALLNYADDDGYFNANPKLIQSECSPLREPSVSIHESLKRLACIGYIRVGKGSDGKTYGQVVTFLDHQRINRPTESKIKGLDIVWEDSLSTHTQLTESSPPERKGKEGKGREGKRASAPPDRKSKKRSLPDDYSLTETLLSKAQAALRDAGKPTVNFKTEFARFCGHFRSEDARNRHKSDWDRAFVNWCLSDYSKPAEQSSGRRDPGVYEAPNVDPELAWQAKAKAYTAMLERGQPLGTSASDGDIRRMVREGLITRELAESRGYDLWRAA